MIASPSYASPSGIAQLVKENSGANTAKTETATIYAVGVPAPEGYTSAILRFWDDKREEAKTKQLFVLELYKDGRLEVLEDKDADWTFETQYTATGGSDQELRKAVYQNKAAEKSEPSPASKTAADSIRQTLERVIESKR